jgi:hypothetical protein
MLMHISWESKDNRCYRDGGQGMVNVLTAEFVQALDSLPREYFFAELLKRCHGGADDTRAQLVHECEEAQLTFIPGSTYLMPSLDNHSASIGVSPDVLIESPTVYAIVEAKRARKPVSFQTEQLAREFVTVYRDAAEKRPLLLLILPYEPPVPVESQGRKGVREAIEDNLPAVLAKFEGPVTDPHVLCGAIEQTVAWITWSEIRNMFVEQVSRVSCESASVRNAVGRLASAAAVAIDWHS